MRSPVLLSLLLPAAVRNIREIAVTLESSDYIGRLRQTYLEMIAAHFRGGAATGPRFSNQQ